MHLDGPQTVTEGPDAPFLIRKRHVTPTSWKCGHALVLAKVCAVKQRVMSEMSPGGQLTEPNTGPVPCPFPPLGFTEAGPLCV